MGLDRTPFKQLSINHIAAADISDEGLESGEIVSFAHWSVCCCIQTHHPWASTEVSAVSTLKVREPRFTGRAMTC